MTEPTTFGIRDWLVIEVLSRECDRADNYYDANWLVIKLSISDSICRFEISGAYLLAFEVQRLLDGVNSLLEASSDGLQFEPTEEFWKLEITKADERGHFRIRINVEPFPGLSSTAEQSSHEYTFLGDQTDLQVLARQLRSAIREFPVKQI